MFPPDANLNAAPAQEMADQRRRGRFSLRSGDGNDRRLAQAIGQLDLTDYRQVERVDPPHDRRGRRYARRKHGTGQAGNDRVDFVGRDETRAEVLRGGDCRRYLLRMVVGRVELHAVLAQHFQAGETAASQTDDQHAGFPVEREDLAHRTIAQPSSEQSSDAIQKRSVTLVSGHPPNSK